MNVKQPILTNRNQAAGLQILEERAPQNSLDYRVQAANRFVLKQMSSDSKRVYPDDTRLDQVIYFLTAIPFAKEPLQVLVTSAMSTLRCLHCGSETMRTSPTYLTDLSYPNLVGSLLLHAESKLTNKRIKIPEFVTQSLPSPRFSRGVLSMLPKSEPGATDAGDIKNWPLERRCTVLHQY